ncbi:MAG: peptidase, partial [Thaumarchaeota archaeon]|nr:peptidase [Nitrososphaerota archaeon]
QTSFNVYVKKYTSLQIHGWVKLIGEFWCSGQINDSEFVQIIKYLIDEEIINIPDTEPGSEPSNFEIPPWLKNVTCWWSQDQIPDEEFAVAIQYLVKENLVGVS